MELLYQYAAYAIQYSHPFVWANLPQCWSFKFHCGNQPVNQATKSLVWAHCKWASLPSNILLSFIWIFWEFVCFHHCKRYAYVLAPNGFLEEMSASLLNCHSRYLLLKLSKKLLLVAILIQALGMWTKWYESLSSTNSWNCSYNRIKCWNIYIKWYKW